MTRADALELLRSICEQQKLTLQDHQILQQALALLAEPDKNVAEQKQE